MTAEVGPQHSHPPSSRSGWRDLVASTEIDMRMFGMVVALAGIWVGFNILSGGDFLTARNLWNLSVQSVSIAIMATGMVLIIVSRNIDLSVGSQLGFIGYTMAMVQTQWIPNSLGLGFDRWYTWIIALGDRDRPRGRDRRRPGFHRRLRRRAVVHRDARRHPDLARPHLPLRPGTDAGADGRQLPAAGRRHPRLARRVAQLAAGSHRLRGLIAFGLVAADGGVVATSSPSAHWRRHRPRRGRLPDRPRRGLARQQRILAGPARQPVRRAHGIVEPAGGLEHPNRHRLPGRDPHRGRVGDDVRRPPSPVRPLRLRHRRQPRCRRARRHQRPSDDAAHVRADGRALRGQRRHPDGPPQRRRHRTGCAATSST